MCSEVAAVFCGVVATVSPLYNGVTRYIIILRQEIHTLQYYANVTIIADCGTVNSEVLVWYFGLSSTCNLHASRR